jgi:hypothetical protein
MSAKHWGLSVFLVWHVIAITYGALASPGVMLPVTPAPYPENDLIAATVTPRLDPVAATLEHLPMAIAQATQPLPWLAAVYRSLVGVSQSWKMFANAPTWHQYLRVRYYVGNSTRKDQDSMAAWTATELVLPAYREDEIRFFRAYWGASRDKAMTSALNQFHNRRDKGLLRPDTTSAELPDSLAPIARYFARRFQREGLKPDERILRTEVWYGIAPMTPPRTTPNRAQIDARLDEVRQYYNGPVLSHFPSPVHGPYYVAEREREGQIEWILEYFEP